MFYLNERATKVTIPPAALDRNLGPAIKERVVSQVVGTLSGKHGLTLAVVKYTKIVQTKVTDTGSVLFTCRFVALVCRPTEQEVLVGKVGEVAEFGFFVEAGPLSVFVAEKERVFGRGDKVRLKLVGLRNDGQKYIGIGSIDEEALGLVDG